MDNTMPTRRPVWQDHRIIGYVTISRQDADLLNRLNDSFYIGYTNAEIQEAKEKERQTAAAYGFKPKQKQKGRLAT